MGKMSEAKINLIVQIITAVVIVVFGVIGYTELLREIKNGQVKDEEIVEEAEEKEIPETSTELEELKTELTMLKAGMTDIQKILTAGMRTMDKLAVENREGIRMTMEKFSDDYTERALQYFRKTDYRNAFPAFNWASDRHPENTTLLFYKIYSLYLLHHALGLSESELTIIENGSRELNERVFNEQERFDFTIDEMQEKLKDMEYDIAMWREQISSKSTMEE